MKRWHLAVVLVPLLAAALVAWCHVECRVYIWGDPGGSGLKIWKRQHDLGVRIGPP